MPTPQAPGENDSDYARRRLREKSPFEGSVRTTDPVSPPQKNNILGTVGEGRDRQTVNESQPAPIVNGLPGGSGTIRGQLVVVSGASTATQEVTLVTA